jgi:sulfhydrogenase subunit gamma (sulfur reductase)
MLDTGFVVRRLRAASVSARTGSVRLFTFVPAEGSSLDDLSFAPGQVAVLSLAGVGDAYFAIASPPGRRGRLEFLVKRGGGVGDRLFESGEGVEVELKNVVGRGFPVDRFEGKDLIFVAAGTAIAPVRAAIDHAIARREAFGRIALVHGVRHPADFAVDDEIDQWRQSNVDVLLTVSRPGETDWSGAVGRVQALLEPVVRDTLDPVVFVCGSEEMMRQTTEALEGMGVPAGRILRNY